MSLVRYFRPENRLASIITMPGGKQIDVAVADADVELMQASDACLSAVDDALARTYRLCDPTPARAELGGLYQTMRDVAGLAGICDLTDLGAAALSFCKFLDHAQDGGRLSPEVVAVHTSVLRILRHPEAIAGGDKQQVLRDLELMVEKLSHKGG